MLYGWEGKRRSGVALAMRHRLGIASYGLSDLEKGDEQCCCCPRGKSLSLRILEICCPRARKVFVLEDPQVLLSSRKVFVLEDPRGSI